MLCAFLVHCGATAEEAIKLYGEKRTLDGCGVTIPSQIRYIHYYEQFMESRTLNYDPRLLSLHEIVIDTIPKPLLSLESGSNYLILTIMSGDVKIYESLPQHCVVDHKLQQIRLSITDKIVLAGDVKMMLWYDSLYKRCHLCHFHFNTTFIGSDCNRLHLQKSEVDKACKDKLHSIFDREFSILVNFSPALVQQSPLPTLDGLPNRAILLKYSNHNGPNNVQISPPYFSSLRLSAARNKSVLSILGMGSKDGRESEESSTSTSSSSSSSSPPRISREENREQISSPPNSAGSTSSFSQVTGGKASRGPVLVHSNKLPFKPAWSDKNRDRDDNWDASSISSDCSESDSLLEWWYTKPPRPTIHTSTGTAAGMASTSTIQPETTVRTDLETRALILSAELQDNGSSESPPLSSPLSSHHHHSGRAGIPILNGRNMATTSPSSAYRSPPHLASSPLAREVKFGFESESGSMPAIGSMLFGSSDEDVSSIGRYKEGLMRQGSTKWEMDGSRLDTEGNDDSRGPERESLELRERERERERGWVDSVSRWFWSAENQKEQEPNGTERQ
ncbi:hypothetical protein BGZ54_004859 [Gamsiella multidivaricata]|nr:hypothetical protein BGZ54_004859 [Gamsiella multidivaricata]